MDGKLLLAIAQAVGLSQAAIAKHLGINRVQPHYWAHGMRPLPTRFLEPLMILIEKASERLIAKPLVHGNSFEERRKAAKARIMTLERVQELLREFMVDGTAKDAHRALEVLHHLPHDWLDKGENAKILVKLGTDLILYGEVLQALSPLLNISHDIYHREKEIEDAHARGELAELGDDGQASAVHQ
jgi:hypothetical protein